MGGGEYLGLRLRRQINHLGVTTTLEIEQAVFAPAMFIVANQLPVGVGRQSGLAGA